MRLVCLQSLSLSMEQTCLGQLHDCNGKQTWLETLTVCAIIGFDI